MNNNHRKINFYTRGQRLAARGLLILWLVGICSPQSALAEINILRLIKCVTVWFAVTTHGVSPSFDPTCPKEGACLPGEVESLVRRSSKESELPEYNCGESQNAIHKVYKRLQQEQRCPQDLKVEDLKETSEQSDFICFLSKRGAGAFCKKLFCTPPNTRESESVLPLRLVTGSGSKKAITDLIKVIEAMYKYVVFKRADVTEVKIVGSEALGVTAQDQEDLVKRVSDKDVKLTFAPQEGKGDDEQGYTDDGDDDDAEMGWEEQLADPDLDGDESYDTFFSTNIYDDFLSKEWSQHGNQYYADFSKTDPQQYSHQTIGVNLVKGLRIGYLGLSTLGLINVNLAEVDKGSSAIIQVIVDKQLEVQTLDLSCGNFDVKDLQGVENIPSLGTLILDGNLICTDNNNDESQVKALLWGEQAIATSVSCKNTTCPAKSPF